MPGPELRIKQGEEVRIRVEKDLPAPTAVHWHGIHLENEMDGVPDMPRPPIRPGESFLYTPPDAGDVSADVDEAQGPAQVRVRAGSGSVGDHSARDADSEAGDSTPSDAAGRRTGSTGGRGSMPGRHAGPRHVSRG